MEGWVCLHRKIVDSVVWTDPNMLKLWSLCLIKASHKDQPMFSLGGQIVPLKKGEFVTGRDSLAEEFNKGVQKRNRVSAITLWRFLKKFEKYEMLNIKTTNKYSVISIKNWESYQSVEQQVNNNRTSSEHQVNTNNNVNNENNVNNKKEDVPKRTKRVYEHNSPYLILAEKLLKQICQNQEIKKPNIQSWADDIRKMIEIDKRTEDQVTRMIDWSQKHYFWSKNILSAQSLRAKYDKMAAQANSDHKKFANNPNRRVERLPDYISNPPKEITMTPEREAELKRKLEQYLSKEEPHEISG